jgi:hypothetical protein
MGRRHDTERNDTQHNDIQRNGLFVTLSINDTQQNRKALYHYAECRVYCWAECHYAECRGADVTKNFFCNDKKEEIKPELAFKRNNLGTSYNVYKQRVRLYKTF